MSLSLDDKLLGEKVHYYCSSSEGEDEDDEDECCRDDRKVSASSTIKESAAWSDVGHQAENNGIVTNTGPKGVLKDWREFKRLETEKREEQEREKRELAKKLTLTCRSHLNDEEEKDADAELLAQLEDLEDEFLKEYRAKRIEEMRHALAEIPKFGKLITLTADNFLEEVDGENPGVTIIVHVGDKKVPACVTMNGCLSCLATEYPTIKFCRLAASDAKMSFKFTENGVPALLVYKSKELVGNFIRLKEEFGDDFYANDIEAFLQEHSFLPNKDSLHVIRDKTTGEVRGALQADLDDSGSDFDVD